MKLVLVDDEPRALRLLSAIIQSFPQSKNHEIFEFSNPKEALDWLLNNRCDGVFLDIEMPELTGLQLAEKLNEGLEEIPAITFVTAFPEFSLKAWDVDAVGYILKPYDDEQIGHALEKIEKYCAGKMGLKEKPYIRCFPEFDVFVKGTPVFFSSKRAKELLALLVHHRGGWVPIDKITFLLLEDYAEDAAKSHIRMLLSRLRQSLSKYEISDIVESSYGKMRVLPEKFDCDYYRFLDGEKELFAGEYMGTYVWAEEERAFLNSL